MSTEPAEIAKTADEIYSIPDRSQQVIEASRLLEFALREYSGDVRSNLAQLCNTNRELFDKPMRDCLRDAFIVRKKIRSRRQSSNSDSSDERQPEPADASFEEKTEAAEALIAAADRLFTRFPRIYPERYRPRNIDDNNVPRSTADKVEPPPESAGGSPLPSYSLSESKWFEKRLSTGQMEKFCHRMGRSLKAGIPISRAWETEANQLSGPLQSSFMQIVLDISEGNTAADAVAKQACFTPMFTEMVRVGEETGRLDQAFLRMADHYRNLIQMRRTFISGITWPVLQLIGASGVMTLFFLILAWLESSMSRFEAPDIFMLGFSPLGNLGLMWTLILLSGVGLFILVKGTVAGWFGSVPMRLGLRIPLIGNTLKTISLSRFAWSFGMAIDAGVDAERAIRLGVRSTNNHYYTTHEEAIAEHVRHGGEFFTALHRTESYPDDFLQAVQVGELTGELTESLDRLSDDYREQAELSLRKISQISGFLIFILVALIMAAGIILMYANYLGTLNEAANNPLGTLEQIESGEKSSNPVIAAKNEMVEDFMQNNEDFKKIQSIYEHLQKVNEMSPNEFLDGF